MAELRERPQIAPQHKWDLSAIFASDQAWEQTLAQVESMMQSIGEHEGHLAEGPEQLLACLQAVEDLRYELGRVVVYAHSQYSVDTRNQSANAHLGQAISLMAKAKSATAFVEPEILATGLDTLDTWCQETPALGVYAHYFDTLLRRQEHVREPAVEELLGQVSDPFGTSESVHSVLADADMVFEDAIDSEGERHVVSQGTFDALMLHPDRELRRTAYESYRDAHLALKNAMAACLAAGVKRDVFFAHARRYPDALSSAVLSSHVPPTVFHNVVDTFRANLPTWHRYWRLRREALGYEELHEYDIKAPLAKSPVVPFDQALDWVCKGLEPLGSDYVATVRQGVLERNWVDVYPCQGKSSGAFSSGAPGTQPLVLMSYVDDIESLSTLAHELGHSMHSHLTWSTQPLIYADYSLFVAEVASNLNQALVRDHLLRTHSERTLQIALIEEAMSNYHRYLFLMPTLARFELETHRRAETGGPLTSSDLNALMADLFEEAYGGELTLDRERLGITWARFHTHLYANFYVYQYATGIAGAQVLAAGILSGKSGAVDRYLGFLRAGASQYPLDALRNAGVDLSDTAAIQLAYDHVASLVDRLGELLASS